MAIVDPYRANSRVDARAFACPGLYRIVPARDGGICRVRVPLGVIAMRQLRAVAVVAETSGNGIVELTNRANLQIRGMPIGDAPLLVSDLVEAGLAPRERWADDMRNVLINPTAGRDASEIFDVRPFAQNLLDTLTATSTFAALSPKFSVQMDGGGEISVADHPHDIWLLAVEDHDGGQLFEMGLAGPLGERADNTDVRLVAPRDSVGVVRALIEEFLETSADVAGLARMRDLVRLVGRTEIWRRVERRIGRTLPMNATAKRRPVGGTTSAPLGIFAQRDPGRVFIGALPPLGRIDVAGLRSLAKVCDGFDVSQVLLTAWRSFLLPDVERGRALEIAKALRKIGLIVDGRDPMARMIACSGNAGCSSGRADVQGDAVRLGARLGSSNLRRTVHLSGCSKSCAVPGTSDLTLVANENGRYDLYRRDATGTSRFGVRIADGIDIEQASRILAGAKA